MVALEKPRVPPGAVLLGYIQGEWIARCIHLNKLPSGDEAREQTPAL